MGLAPALIMGGGSLLTAFMGANAQNKAARQQAEAAAAQLQAQQQHNAYLRALSGQQTNINLAPRENALGDRVFFNSDRGFVEDASAGTEQVQSAGRGEMLKAFIEMMALREERGRASDRRGKEGRLSDALRNTIGNTTQKSPVELAMMMQAATHGAGSQHRDALAAKFNTQSLRAGSGAGQKVANEVNSQQNAAGSKGLENLLQALQIGPQLQGQKVANLGNLANQFSQRAAGIDRPGAPGAIPTPQLPAQSPVGATQGAAALQGRPALTNYSPKPNFGNSLAVGAGAFTLSNFFKDKAVQDFFKNSGSGGGSGTGNAGNFGGGVGPRVSSGGNVPAYIGAGFGSGYF